LNPYIFVGLEEVVKEQATNNEKYDCERIKQYFFTNKIEENIYFKYPEKYEDFEKLLASRKRPTALYLCRSVMVYRLKYTHRLTNIKIAHKLGFKEHTRVTYALKELHRNKEQKHIKQILKDLCIN
jgi:chromosomal replication initiation ATPase DnaA